MSLGSQWALSEPWRPRGLRKTTQFSSFLIQMPLITLTTDRFATLLNFNSAVCSMSMFVSLIIMLHSEKPVNRRNCLKTVPILKIAENCYFNFEHRNFWFFDFHLPTPRAAVYIRPSCFSHNACVHSIIIVENRCIMARNCLFRMETADMRCTCNVIVSR